MKTHEDSGLFGECIRHTATESGFLVRLVEKDYYCSVLLSYLREQGLDMLVFKGGTCISKVYTDFYRLSEDLDFVIPISPDAKRSERRKAMDPVKQALNNLPAQIPGLQSSEPVRGHNASKQYIAWFTYRSAILPGEESIKVEVGLRESLLRSVHHGGAKTLLVDTLKAAPAAEPIGLPCMSIEEIYAEKVRAALSRRVAAIRDFYDLDYAVRALPIDLTSDEMLDLVRQKLNVPDNEEPDVSKERLSVLEDQVEAELKAVLRDDDYAAFDLKRAIALTQSVYQAL